MYFIFFPRYVEYLMKQSDKKINDSVACDLFCNSVLVAATNECIFKAPVLGRGTETAYKKVMFCKRENLYDVLLLPLNM
jgi:hypothetical protein